MVRYSSIIPFSTCHQVFQHVQISEASHCCSFQQAQEVTGPFCCVCKTLKCCNIVTCFLFRAERDTHLFGPGKLVIKICSHLWFRSQKNLRMRRIRKRRPKISVSSPPLAGVHGRAIFLELAESTNYATKRWRFAIFFGTARPWEVLMIDMNYTFFFFFGTWILVRKPPSFPWNSLLLHETVGCGWAA